MKKSAYWFKCPVIITYLKIIYKENPIELKNENMKKKVGFSTVFLIFFLKMRLIFWTDFSFGGG